jgi:hypothetical protein
MLMAFLKSFHVLLNFIATMSACEMYDRALCASAGIRLASSRALQWTSKRP